MQRSLILIYGFNDITNKQKANGALIDSTSTLNFIVLKKNQLFLNSCPVLYYR